MTLVACGLLALGVLAFMISPMLEGSARRPWSAWSAWSRRDDLLKKKDFIYSAIRELNIDYNMGKLAAEDHEALRQEYMKEASDVLDELDRTVAAGLPVAEQIEEAVLEIRRRKDPTATAVDAQREERKAADEGPADERPVQSVSGKSCVRCGTINEASANFCVECGLSLKRSTCSSCGTENPATAKFCAQCGEKLI